MNSSPLLHTAASSSKQFIKGLKPFTKESKYSSSMKALCYQVVCKHCMLINPLDGMPLLCKIHLEGTEHHRTNTSGPQIRIVNTESIKDRCWLRLGGKFTHITSLKCLQLQRQPTQPCFAGYPHLHGVGPLSRDWGLSKYKPVCCLTPGLSKWHLLLSLRKKKKKKKGFLQKYNTCIWLALISASILESSS